MDCSDIAFTKSSHIHESPSSPDLPLCSLKLGCSFLGFPKLLVKAPAMQNTCVKHRVLCQSSATAASGRDRTANGLSAAAAGVGNIESSQNFAADISSSVPSLTKNVHEFGSAHEVLQSLVTAQKPAGLSEKELVLRKRLKERRVTVQQLLIEAMTASKMGPTYSKNVAKNMPEFIDHVMIQAAALRKQREYTNASFNFRARVYIDQSGVAKVIKWLKHNSFSAPRMGKLVFLVEDYEGNLQPKIRWLKSINVHGRDLGTALTRETRILERTIEELEDSVELLENSGVKKEWIGWVVRRSPKVLACDVEELQERVSFFSRLGIKPDDFGRMVYNFPATLGHFSMDEMCSKVEYFKAFGLEDNSLGKVIARKPQLIARSIEDDLKPIVKFLYYLGVDGYGLRRILLIEPSVFCLNIAENIAPKIRFLRAVGVHEEAIGDVIVKYPPLLTYSLDKKIRPLVRFLLEMAWVREDKVGKILTLQPNLISCSVADKLEVTVKFFLFHGIQKADIGAMVADFPMLLRYSLAVLKPKFRYITKVMARPLEDIVKFPRLFSYSLEGRIAPRHKVLVEKGLHFDLRAMLACSDEEFVGRLKPSDGTAEDCEMYEAYNQVIVTEKSCAEAL